MDPDAHRINGDKVIRDLEAVGFELVDRSDLLALPLSRAGRGCILW